MFESTRSREPARLALFMVWVAAYVLSYFFRSANAVIAGDLRLELGLNAEQLGMMTSVFFASFAIVQLPLGSALDRWGPRFVVPALLLVGAAGSALFAIAPGYTPLIIARSLLGVGFAGVLMGGLKAFASRFEARRFATLSGLMVGLGSAGALLAGTPLALLTQTLGWRAVFAWGALIILIAALGIVAVTGEALNPRGTLGDDPPRPEAPLAHAEAPGLEAAPASTTRRGSEGLLSVISSGAFWRIAFINFSIVGSVLAIQGLWAGPYLVDVYDLEPLTVGNLLIALGIGVVAGNLISGWLADRVGRRHVVALHASIAVIANGTLALAPPVGVPGLALVYLALGFSGAFVAVLFAHTRTIFPPRLLGRAITAVNFFGIGGAMALQWVMGAIIEAGGTGAAGYGAAAYRPAFLLTTVLSLAAAALYLSGDSNKHTGA